MDMTMLELGDILPNASVMIVSVTGSTTSGQPLSEADLADCFRACDEGNYALLVMFCWLTYPLLTSCSPLSTISMPTMMMIMMMMMTITMKC